MPSIAENFDYGADHQRDNSDSHNRQTDGHRHPNGPSLADLIDGGGGLAERIDVTRGRPEGDQHTHDGYGPRAGFVRLDQ